MSLYIPPIVIVLPLDEEHSLSTFKSTHILYAFHFIKHVFIIKTGRWRCRFHGVVRKGRRKEERACCRVWNGFLRILSILYLDGTSTSMRDQHTVLIHATSCIMDQWGQSWYKIIISRSIHHKCTYLRNSMWMIIKHTEQSSGSYYAFLVMDQCVRSKSITLVKISTKMYGWISVIINQQDESLFMQLTIILPLKRLIVHTKHQHG